MSQFAIATNEEWAFLRAYINPPEFDQHPVIFEGDSLCGMQQLPADTVDLIITSPPYPRSEFDCRKIASQTLRSSRGIKGFSANQRDRGLDGKRRYGFSSTRESHGGNGQFIHGHPNEKGVTGLAVMIHPDKWLDWFMPFAQEMLRIIKPGRGLLLNLGGMVYPGWNQHTFIYDLPGRMKSLGWNFIREIIWAKPNRPPCGGIGNMIDCTEKIYWFSRGVPPIWFPSALSQRTERGRKPIVRNVVHFPLGQTRWPKGSTHFACFPAALAEWGITGWSKPGDLVLDPFLGSGTTGLAAAKLRRSWLGMELNPNGEINCARARFEKEFPVR